MENKLVSIIVPVWNTEKYLDKCISSLLEQSYKNIEVLLINDGSTDDSKKICEKYKLFDKRIKLFNKQNGGLSSARNLGLENVQGYYIFFVDSDDWIEKDTLSEMVLLCENTSSDICCCGGVKTDGSKKYDYCFQTLPTGTVANKTEIVKKILTDEMSSHVVRGLYKKDCWKNVRFPLNILYEDISTTFLAFENSEYICFIDKPFYNYRYNENSISNSPNKLKSYFIYRGFKNHYEFSLEKYPDVAEECLLKCMNFAISTIFHAYSDAKNDLYQYVDECYEFLEKTKNRNIVKRMKRSRRFMIRLLFFSKGLFKFLCGFLYYTHIQKMLKLESK